MDSCPYRAKIYFLGFLDYKERNSKIKKIREITKEFGREEEYPLTKQRDISVIFENLQKGIGFLEECKSIPDLQIDLYRKPF